MPADEYASWLAYFEVEPWGTYAMELVIGKALQLQCAASPLSKDVPDLTDLMPFVSHRKRLLGPKVLSPEELLNKIRQFGK